jgi:3-hydroxyacyl-CoA dehydrogenase/enoyl-CoA hydratase/3-hydroxybutyryl-CoA epimerase
MLAKARAFIDANPESRQPWDKPGYRIPGGTPSNPKFAANLPAFPANLRKQTRARPTRRRATSSPPPSRARRSTSRPRRSSRPLLRGAGHRPDLAKNMIQAFFFDLQAVNSGANRPKGIEPRPVRKVAVLGAGMMGAGIAYSCARAGIDVVLKDVSAEAAEKGKATPRSSAPRPSPGAVRPRRRRTRCSPASRRPPTRRTSRAATLVIEAVFEDTALKHKVFQEIEHIVEPGRAALLQHLDPADHRLAEGVERQVDFIGLHFFSPVDKMPLVEIIKGERTGDEALARAFDLVRQIKKTPIVVNDSRGFFTSRVIGTFINEGVAMVGEGIEPASIEQAAAQAGYPAKVLSLMDELTLTLPRKIRAESKRAVEEAGGTWPAHPAEAVIDRMVDEFGRTGRSGGAGFYEYGETASAPGLWPGLREHFTREGAEIPSETVPFRTCRNACCSPRRSTRSSSLRRAC